ncbi:MAG: PrsW family glutamic-type intramembrane protease [Treponema sp.]|nr:PrsW family glutamic-type intramembrane protease [Treponema sp.]
MTATLWAVLAPALLPVVFVFFYVYKKDKTEKEPLGFVLKVLIWGAIFSIPCAFIELRLENLLKGVLDESTVKYAFWENTVGVALVEEFSKWLVIMIFVWKNDNFDYSYDGIVYATTASLGFAALENVMYIISFGSSVSLGRAIFSIPGHATFGVFMGGYLSRGKKRFLDKWPAVLPRVMALVVPTIIHGIYDFLLSEQLPEEYNYVFFVYVLVLDFMAWRKIKRGARKDKPLGVVKHDESLEVEKYGPRKAPSEMTMGLSEDESMEFRAVKEEN